MAWRLLHAHISVANGETLPCIAAYLCLIAIDSQLFNLIDNLLALCIKAWHILENRLPVARLTELFPADFLLTCKELNNDGLRLQVRREFLMFPNFFTGISKLSPSKARLSKWLVKTGRKPSNACPFCSAIACLSSVCHLEFAPLVYAKYTLYCHRSSPTYFHVFMDRKLKSSRSVQRNLRKRNAPAIGDMHRLPTRIHDKAEAFVLWCRIACQAFSISNCALTGGIHVLCRSIDPALVWVCQPEIGTSRIR